ncbi:unnamed protein product [Cuscuta epithymum]|uniref:Uncharacterized protein n=1 Tax=Cuscuta epithymum TaxID=186058 RepID=A0AAV0CVI3_9ASTE|nr:unnamed protein product [Cuscuta epithymum]
MDDAVHGRRGPRTMRFIEIRRHLLSWTLRASGRCGCPAGAFWAVEYVGHGVQAHILYQKLIGKLSRTLTSRTTHGGGSRGGRILGTTSLSVESLSSSSISSSKTSSFS